MENLNETETITPETTRQIWAAAKRYATLCHVIEAIWLKRKDKDYREIDFENLPWLMSPESKKIADFIEDLYIGPIEESGPTGDEAH